MKDSRRVLSVRPVSRAALGAFPAESMDLLTQTASAVLLTDTGKQSQRACNIITLLESSRDACRGVYVSVKMLTTEANAVLFCSALGNVGQGLVRNACMKTVALRSRDRGETARWVGDRFDYEEKALFPLLLGKSDRLQQGMSTGREQKEVCCTGNQRRRDHGSAVCWQSHLTCHGRGRG